MIKFLIIDKINGFFSCLLKSFFNLNYFNEKLCVFYIHILIHAYIIINYIRRYVDSYNLLLKQKQIYIIIIRFVIIFVVKNIYVILSKYIHTYMVDDGDQHLYIYIIKCVPYHAQIHGSNIGQVMGCKYMIRRSVYWSE